MRSLITLGLITISFNLLSQDQIKLDSLMMVLNRSDTDSKKINTLLEISRFYQGKSYEKAIEYADEAVNLAARMELDSLEALATRTLAVQFFAMGDYRKATTLFFKALEHYEVVGDTTGLLIINNNLGVIYDRLKEYDNALERYFKASDLLNQLDADGEDKQVALRKATLYNNIGNVYQTKGDIQSAIEYYENSLAIARASDVKRIMGIALNNLGKLHFMDIQEYDKAIGYINEGLKVRLEEEDKAEIAKSYNVLSNYYRATGDLKKAKESVEIALEYGKDIGSTEVQIYGYSTLSEIESKIGNFENALEAYKAFKSLNDSIQAQSASSEITRLQLKYDFEKAEQDRAHEQKLSRDRYIATIIILGVCLLLAVLLAIIVRMRSRQVELRRKNLVQDLELKNKELTTNVMYLIRKNELINDVAERLLKIQPKILPDNKKIIQSIILDLQREADSDSWQEFELRFNQVHTEFYNNLRKIHPDLSPAEEKLCAFLRLNMSSKEIAAITQQSVKSVEVARSRLRKKLNLTNTASNLITYLSSL